MKAKSVFLGMAWLGLAAIVAPNVAIGAPPAKPPAAPAKPPAGKPAGKDKGKPGSKEEAAAATPAKPIVFAPSTLSWGIDQKKLASVYDKVLDEDFKPQYLKVNPGAAMEALDAQLSEKKDEFRRSQIDFGPTPTGIDATPLRQEITYGNNESLMQLNRAGKTRDFFFIGKRLYKFADELPLCEKCAWGKTFDEAATKLGAYYGTAGRKREADPKAGRNYPEVDWRDSTNEVRAVDWGNGKFGLFFSEVSTVNQLASLRTNKASDKSGVDPTVADVLHQPSQPPELKDASKDKSKQPPPKTKPPAVPPKK